jgi:hypothetical protein
MKKLLAVMLALLLAVSLTSAMSSAIIANIEDEGYYLIIDESHTKYTGEQIRPAFYVVEEDTPYYAAYDLFEDGTLNPNDYALDPYYYDYYYSNNIEVGTATITVTGKNGYDGTITGTFSISRIKVKMTVTANDDKTKSITSYDIPAEEYGSVSVYNWMDNYDLEQGTEFISSDDGIVLTKEFLEGKTGRKFEGDPYLYLSIVTPHYFSSVKTKAYNISNLYCYLDDNELTYNGKNRTVSPHINGLNRSDFTITYAKKTRKAVGTYYFTIKGKGKFIGTLKGSFRIIPKRPSKITSAKRTKTKATVKWKRVAGASGYQVVLYRVSSEGSDDWYDVDYKTATVKGSYKTSKTFKAVKKSKYSRVKVRAYKYVNGKKYYSNWKTKKF